MEQHNESRHKQKHREHAAYDAFRQNETQIITKAELHQHQATRPEIVVREEEEISTMALLRAAMSASRASRPLSRSSIYAVAEDNGVIDGQGKLEHHGDGVGDEGNRVKEKVGAHVEDGGDHKHNEKDQDLPDSSWR